VISIHFSGVVKECFEAIAADCDRVECLDQVRLSQRAELAGSTAKWPVLSKSSAAR